jgi:hypothetical protein
MRNKMIRIIFYKKNYFKNYNWKQAAQFSLKRETGGNPVRCRHCKGEFLPLVSEINILLNKILCH